MRSSRVESVAVIGAGAAGAAAAVALKAEGCFDVIRVFERRESAGGTWIYDPEPSPVPISPGTLPPDYDRPVKVPGSLPIETKHDGRQRFANTPIYEQLTTNVPDIAMSFTDLKFPYGPFVPHWIPRQYIENYFSYHQADDCLVLNTTVEEVRKIKGNRWRLVLRKYDAAREIDIWWQEEFDALLIANGHYSVPFTPHVQGLKEFIKAFPGRVEHSKIYRTPRRYIDQRVLVIGNSASGHDVAMQLLHSKLCKGPIYVSRRSRNRWDGPGPPEGMEWKPVVSEYRTDGTIVFVDGTMLSNIDKVVYCTGFKASFPFWDAAYNGRPLYSYDDDRLINNYQHTFTWDFPTLAFVGMPRVLTFRSFEYQAIAIARLWAGRAKFDLPPIEQQKAWLERRATITRGAKRRFHQIEWEYGETMDWFRYLFELAGLPELEGIGKCPPVLDERTRWAINHIRKYPEPGKGGKPPSQIASRDIEGDHDDEWEMLEEKDILHFI